MTIFHKHKFHKNVSKTSAPTMVAALLLSLMSCEIETSENGKLDGFWHLERIDSLNNNKIEDYSNKLIFWGIQMHLIETKDIDNNNINHLYLRFKQTTDSLYINKIYENHWHEDNYDDETAGDVPVSLPNNDTRHYGINAIPETFLKEELNGRRMVLRSKTLRMTFRRF